MPFDTFRKSNKKIACLQIKYISIFLYLCILKQKAYAMNSIRRFFTLVCFSLIPLLAGAQILPGVDPSGDSLALARVRVKMDSIRRHRPTVALVLAGGGARGLAHLGVIKLIEDLGIPVDMVTGTSMGGLVGGLYSLGYSHDQLDSLVRGINWPVMMSDKVPDAYVAYRLRKYRERFNIRVPFRYDKADLQDKKRAELAAFSKNISKELKSGSSDMLDDAVSRMGMGMPDGFLFGINIRNMLSSVSVGYQDSLNFSDLPIPYACVATDIYSMKPKYWTGGRFVDALRSTMCIPFYFRAVRRDGEILLDGGMRNNFPTDLARLMGADIVIGSEMDIRRSIDELNSPVDLMFQSISLMSSGTLDKTMKLTDLDVHHELEGYTMLSFDEKSVKAIIDQGYQNALSHKAEFEAVAKMTGAQPQPERHRAVNIALKKVKVDSIRFNGIVQKEQKFLLRNWMCPSDDMYGKEEVERLMNYIYGTGAFESVTYRMEGDSEPYTLVFDCQKGQINDAGLGVHVDTDEYVYVSAHLGLGTRRLYGPSFQADLKLGNNSALIMDASLRPIIGIPSIGLCFRNTLVNASFMEAGLPYTDRRYRMGMDLYVEDTRMIYGKMRMGITADKFPYRKFLSSAGEIVGWRWKDYWLSAFMDMTIDTFDDGYFPTRGVQVGLRGRFNFKGYSTDRFYLGENYSPVVPKYGTAFGHFGAAFSPHSRFTILPSVYLGWNSDRIEANPDHVASVGGNVAGRYTENQIPFFGLATSYRVTDILAGSALLDLRYRFTEKDFITLRGGFFMNCVKIPHGLLMLEKLWAVGAEYARKTIVGPLKVGAQWCDETKFTVSASIGFDF